MERTCIQEEIRLPVTAILLVEHRMLRELMEAMERALLANLPGEALCQRAAMLEVALDRHAAREEEQLLTPLRTRSETARHLVDMMEIVHDEVRDTFQEIQTEPDPRSKLWTILEITEAHFQREEQEVFPLAASLLHDEELFQPVSGQAQRDAE